MIATLTERLAGNETILAAEFSGLSVREVSQLRDRLRGADARMSVVKNTLARRAVEAAGRPALLEHLTGPSALVWVAGDPAAAAKALAGFVKEHPDRARVKGGLLGDAPLSADEIGRLASLPSREHLLAQLAGGLNAPITGLATGLSNLISGLARALAALEAQRAAEASNA